MIDILVLTPFESTAYSMCSEKCRTYGERKILTYACYDTQHLEFIVKCESVAALDFHSSCAKRYYITYTRRCLVIQSVLAIFVQPVGRIENATASCGYLGITQAIDFVDKLPPLLPAKTRWVCESQNDGKSQRPHASIVSHSRTGHSDI